ESTTFGPCVFQDNRRTAHAGEYCHDQGTGERSYPYTWRLHQILDRSSMMEWTVRRAALGLALGVFAALGASAQDPQFTQFYANPLYLNPAFAGTARCPRVVMNYRNQWPALTGTFVTTSASYDQHVDGMMGGLGRLVTHDQAG